MKKPTTSSKTPPARASLRSTKTNAEAATRSAASAAAQATRQASTRKRVAAQTGVQKKNGDPAAAPVASPTLTPMPTSTLAPKKRAKPAPAAATLQQSTANAPEDAASIMQKKRKLPKLKLVRDGFTIPEDEHNGLRKLKRACSAAGLEVKKSELIRIGIALVCALDPDTVREKIGGLAPIKRGRPAAA